MLCGGVCAAAIMVHFRRSRLRACTDLQGMFGGKNQKKFQSFFGQQSSQSGGGGGAGDGRGSAGGGGGGGGFGGFGDSSAGNGQTTMRRAWDHSSEGSVR
jgi:hypothetical protein